MSETTAPRESRSPWRLALAFALAGLACALLLGGLSAWFLGSVAIAGLSAAALTFNFHVPAGFIRLFAVGRTAARYGERLAGHRAALTDQVARRAALFSAMAAAPAVRRAGWQLGDAARLADYLDDVEDVDFGRLRIDMPATVLGLGLAACALATLVVAPLALLPIAALPLLLAIACRRAAIGMATSLATLRAAQRRSAQALGAAMAATVPLKAEGRWPQQLEAALAPQQEADRALASLRRTQANLEALAGLIGPAACLSVMAAAWVSGARGEALLIPAFLAFAWLALAETMQGAARMLMAQLRRDAARAALAQDRAPAVAAIGTVPRRLDLAGLLRRAPDGRPIGRLAQGTVEAGRPTVLSGASGAGKTSLLKQIAGWVGDDAIASDAGALSPAARRALATFCPHDAAVLSDTVRENLFAKDATDAERTAALDAVELTQRVAAAGGLDGWITQDTLSLGEAQRLNLARALLSDRPVVLLDEPMEHLDAEQGARILARLLERLGDRIVVLSSHREAELADACPIRL